jgi:glycosyltransferase involved in cell wall biosynthesis
VGWTADTDDQIRVLWVSKGLGPGGAERLLLAFARVADHDRFKLSAAYLLPYKDHLTGALEDAGVRTTCLDGVRTWDLRWLLRLRRLVRSRRVEVVHLHSPLVAALARPALATMRRRPAIVTTGHNTWRSFHPVTRALDRLTSRLDDHVFVVSEPVHRSLPKGMRRRSEVLVHGVDVDAIARRRGERERIRTELGLAGQRVVITIANLRADKDHPNLFSAAERVLARHDDVVFLTIGQGQLEAELRADLARRGLGDRFRMLGHQEDPIRFLVAAEVFTLASRHEGLPISMLEAMAAGLPAAVTAVGGIPDVITDGVEGRLVPPADPEALAAAIEEVLDPATNARMSAAASERARDFDIRPAVERQQEVYAELAARRR